MSLTSIENVDGSVCSKFLALNNLFNTHGKFVEEWETETGKTARIRILSLMYSDLKKINSI